MIDRLFRAIRDQIECLFGGSKCYLFKKSESPRPITHIKKSASFDNEQYYIGLTRGSAKLTEFEKAIFRELVTALTVLYNGFSSTTHKAHFRTAVSTALTDATIARYLRADESSAFWSVQSLIQALKKLSFERYEGAPATTGFLVERIGISKFEKYVNKNAFELVKFGETKVVNDDFFSGPLSFRYVDGHHSLYVGRVRKLAIRISSILDMPNCYSTNVIDRLSHVNLFKLLDHSGNNSFAAILNNKSEIEVLDSLNTLFVWRKGKWNIFDPDIFYHFLGDVLDKGSIKTLLWTVYSLSKVRHGTLILIGDIKRKQLNNLRKGSVAGKHKLSQELLKYLEGKSIIELKENGELLRILSADGLTIFDSKGILIETGFITNTSAIKRDDVTGGGRTTAAVASSIYGKVVKVSEDGPIEFYEGERRVYKFG